MTDENMALVEISRAQQALERANDIHEIIDLRDKVMAMQLFANAQGFKDAAQEAKIYQLKAERKAGDWLRENVDHRGATAGNELQDETRLPDGIDKNESHRWQLEASVPEPVFNEWIDECLATGKEISANRLQQIAHGVPHVFYNSGENEWYTPPEYIEAARSVLGEIELDPASSETANKIVGAVTYFTAQDDGLKYHWSGKVWMNPPYSSDLVGQFTKKLINHIEKGDVTEAVVLVNNATETAWFQGMLDWASAVCFISRRIKFIDMNGNPSGAPLQGQAILYFGGNVPLFAKEFDGFGTTLYK